MNRVNIFIGNYGSGKTELSISAALKLKEKHSRVILSDMDIVNPYFRSSERAKMLENLGIKVISPVCAGTQVDVPALSADAAIPFQTKEYYCVIDCGGDSAGATALGAYAPYIEKIKDEIEIFFVANARRPFQETAQEIIDSINIIEHVSKLKATAIINNTNVSRETTVKDLIYGYEIILAAALQKGIPLKYNVGSSKILKEFSQYEHIGRDWELTPCMRPEFLNS